MKRLLSLLVAASLLLTAGCAALGKPSYIEVTDPPRSSTLPTSTVTTTVGGSTSGTSATDALTTTGSSGSSGDGTASSTMADGPATGTTSATASTTTSTSKSTTATSPTTATTVSQPVGSSTEHRALWVSTYANLDFPSDRTLSAKALKAECDTIVSRAASLGMTTLYFQVRPCGDALYPSAYFPSSRYVVANQGDPLPLDILEYMTAAAHNAGLELYAWVNPVRVRNANDNKPLHSSNPAVLHPEWTFSLSDGAIYYNLGLPEVRTLIANGVAEIVENYDVDGVIFDDYFYPYSGISDKADAAAYATYGAGKSLADFRRASVNQTLKASHDRIKAIDSNCRFGVSPFGIRLNSDAGTGGQQSYHTIYCDAVAWMSGGYVDFIAPQLYWSCSNSAAPYKALAAWWASTANTYRVDFYPALAAYRYDSAQATSDVFTAGEITRQVEYSRELDGYGGCSLFRYYFLFEGAVSGIDEEIKDLFT